MRPLTGTNSTMRVKSCGSRYPYHQVDEVSNQVYNSQKNEHVRRAGTVLKCPGSQIQRRELPTCN